MAQFGQPKVSKALKKRILGAANDVLVAKRGEGAAAIAWSTSASQVTRHQVRVCVARLVASGMPDLREPAAVAAKVGSIESRMAVMQIQLAELERQRAGLLGSSSSSSSSALARSEAAAAPPPPTLSRSPARRGARIAGSVARISRYAIATGKRGGAVDLSHDSGRASCAGQVKKTKSSSADVTGQRGKGRGSYAVRDVDAHEWLVGELQASKKRRKGRPLPHGEQGRLQEQSEAQ